MSENSDRYIPAASYDRLTPLYDFFIRWTMPESRFKRHLIRQARIERGHRVLDVGCGTGTLALLIKRTHPEAEVVGLDGDPKILGIAHRKAAKAGLVIAFDEGMAFSLPYPDASFDRVLSSLVFHHLTRDNKARTLQEVFRVLRPGGELHLADFGKPHNALMQIAALPLRTFHSSEAGADNLKGLLPQLFRDAGFQGAHESARYMTLFGTLALYQAQK